MTGATTVSRHHAIGSIRYDTVDATAAAGTLLYLKASLTGDEPRDIQDYAARHPAFPHEPTSDQFFDEAQFESYRRLGEHVAWEKSCGRRSSVRTRYVSPVPGASSSLGHYRPLVVQGLAWKTDDYGIVVDWALAIRRLWVDAIQVGGAD